ncbi:MAG: AAA family ATPase [Cyclobacteriaceae bacterium]
MKILIFGASGSGTTTLGKALAERLGYMHVDADDYYWKKTVPPFQEKIALSERNARLTSDFLSAANMIVSGSMVSWGDYWKTAFDLAIFLYLPQEIRMERLKKREAERYGDLLLTDQATIENSKAFLAWAKKYDDEGFDGRSLKIHRNWIKALKCPVLSLDGDLTLPERIQKVMTKMKKLADKPA